MRTPDVLIVAICMKHRPEQWRRNYLFFWCMDPAVEPSSRKVQLSSRLCLGPFEWIHSPLSLWQAGGNGWGARFQQKAHLHPHDKVSHKGEAGFFERGTLSEFPTHGPHKQLRSTKCYSFEKDYWKYIQLKHIHAFSQTDHSVIWHNDKNILVMVRPLV